LNKQDLAPQLSGGDRIDTLFSMPGARADRWRALHAAAQAWARGRTDRAPVDAALEDIGAYEEFFAYPGTRLIAALRERITTGAAEGAAALSRRISEAILTRSYKHDTGAWEAVEQLAEALPELSTATMGHGAAHRPYFEMLVVSPNAVERGAHQVAELRRLRRPEDAFVYEAVPVASFEDAVCATLLNPALAAVTIYEGFEFASRHDAPVLRSVLAAAGFDEGHVAAEDMALALADGLKRLRPELDVYLLSDRHVERIAGDARAASIRRVLYSIEEMLELHLSVLEGVADRFRTPFFDNLKKYAMRPISTFHALPIARGKSVFKSDWIRDMGEFYGLNIFLAESSATTGGLDSLLEPTGNIKEAQDMAARAFGADHVFFVTNGTSTSNKMVHQALVAPGDIVILDRNCHKSHHYGLVLAGGQPLYIDAFPMTEYSMYGAVPLAGIKKALLDLKAEGRLDKAKMVDLTNCTFDGHIYNTRRVMEECLAIKPDLIFLWDEAWFGFARWSPFLRPRTAMGAAEAIEKWMADPPRSRPGSASRPSSARARRRRRCSACGCARPAQDPAAGLPDQLHAQVDVGAAAGLDAAGQGRRFRRGRGAVPRGGLHPRLDLAQPAADREPRRRAPADGARGLRPRRQRHRDRPRHPPRGERASADLEVLPGARRRRDDPGRSTARAASSTSSRRGRGRTRSAACTRTSSASTRPA
jgi:arginine decarboxylase